MDRSGTVSNLTTDRKGEVIFARKENGGMNVWAYTDADKAAPSTGIYSDYYNSSTPMATERMSMFTDRSLYRPGQTVHTAAIVYRQDDATRHRSAVADRRVTFTLRDANYKEVATTTATTDRFGTALTDFALPAAGLTGQFSVTAQTVDASGSVYFNVEEYKRPTFEVTFTIIPGPTVPAIRLPSAAVPAPIRVWLCRMPMSLTPLCAVMRGGGGGCPEPPTAQRSPREQSEPVPTAVSVCVCRWSSPMPTLP